MTKKMTLMHAKRTNTLITWGQHTKYPPTNFGGVLDPGGGNLPGKILTRLKNVARPAQLKKTIALAHS